MITLSTATLIHYALMAALAVVPAVIVHLYHTNKTPAPKTPATPASPVPAPAAGTANLDNHPVVQSILRALASAPVVQVPGHPGLTMTEEDLQAVLKDLVTLKTSMARLNPPAIAPPANLTEK